MSMRVCLKSVGCRTNQEEMTSLEMRLKNDGLIISEDESSADVIVLNTCSVTAAAESGTRRLVGTINRKNPQAKILLTGCLAQQSPEALLDKEGVHWIVGNGRKNEIADIIQNSESGIFHTIFDDAPADIADFSTDIKGPKESNRTRFALKIQEGCDFSCSYCIVPSLRGPSRSKKTQVLVDTVKRAVDAGYHEIVITGTHIGQYRDETRALPELLDLILSVDSNFRIRISSLDPNELSEDLLSLIVQSNRICDHLHVSIQSLAEKTLRNMNRTFNDPEMLRSVFERYFASRKFGALGGDFIVGFPGETEKDFELTCEKIKSLGFTYGHVFRYSPRPGTPAATMAGQVSEIVKKERSEKLASILFEQRKAFGDRCVGETFSIIAEKESPLTGLAGNYLRVSVPGYSGEKGRVIPVTISAYDPDTATATAQMHNRDGVL